MEELLFEQQKEIVLTYRPGEQVEPVQLSYQRDLPQGMQPAPAAPEPAWRAAIAPPEKQRRSGWGMALFVVLSVLVVLVCLGVGFYYFAVNGFPEPPASSRREDPAPEPDGGYDAFWRDWELPEGETTIARFPNGGDARLELAGTSGEVLAPGAVYEKVNPSVVTVLGYQPMAASVGTGIIFSDDGYILTNYHVIAGSSECSVLVTDQFGVDTRYDALLVGGDADMDLAVLKADAQGLIPAEFGVSDDLAIGDRVYAIGNPLGIELRNTFTDGIVSAVNRDVYVDGVTMTLIQTNAALNSGNSGGPLINQYGQVVGVNTIKMMSGDDTIEGLGFAIPTSLAVRWVNELIAFGELQPQPVLGVTISRIPEVLPDGTMGLRVESVTPGLSGDEAGMRVGDYVVSFNGQNVATTEEILALRRELRVGDQVPVRVCRDGAYLDLTMTMMAEK